MARLTESTRRPVDAEGCLADASWTMDLTLAHSLLRHPLRRALVVLDAEGALVAGNDRARDTVTPALHERLRPALARGMAHLAEFPDREVQHVHREDGLELECVLVAVREGGRTIGYTVSVFDVVESPDLAESPDRAR